MASTLDLHLAVRAVHVLGMAVLLGGAAFTWNAFRRDAATGGLSDAALASAVDYEWLFWGAAGAMLVTGVGNLGAVGAPGPETRWGTVFLPKLFVVLLLFVGSSVRTLLVLRVRSLEGRPARATVVLRRSYALTTWALVAIVAIAEVLVYG